PEAYPIESAADRTSDDNHRRDGNECVEQSKHCSHQIRATTTSKKRRLQPTANKRPPRRTDGG
ncbi:hypothetical protein A2U01_0080735, partial [Trifolium medium]|nr:hypothetical protein [Trifolium medium]